MYVICDDKNRILTIQGVKLFGKKVDMFACLAKEEHALDLLFELEESGTLKGHTVREVPIGSILS